MQGAVREALPLAIKYDMQRVIQMYIDHVELNLLPRIQKVGDIIAWLDVLHHAGLTAANTKAVQGLIYRFESLFARVTRTYDYGLADAARCVKEGKLHPLTLKEVLLATLLKHPTQDLYKYECGACENFLWTTCTDCDEDDVRCPNGCGNKHMRRVELR